MQQAKLFDIQETSRQAYRDIIPELGRRQQEVLICIQQNPYMCNRELAFLLGLPINQVTPRVKELRDYGKVKRAGIKIDSQTRKHVLTWEAI